MYMALWHAIDSFPDMPLGLAGSEAYFSGSWWSAEIAE